MKKQDPTYDRLMNYEIGFDEFVALRAKERLEKTLLTTEKLPMRTRNDTESMDLVNAARRSIGLGEIKTDDDGYKVSLEADAAEQSSMVTDAEFVAAELAEANERNADDARDTLQAQPIDTDKWDDGRLVATGPGLFETVWLELKSIGTDIKKDATKVGVALAAVSAAFVTNYRYLVNTATEWALKEKEKLEIARKEFFEQAERAACIRQQERAANSAVTLVVFRETLDDLFGVIETMNTKLDLARLENQALHKRLATIEKAIRGDKPTAEPVNVETLDQLLTSLKHGKVVHAVNAYRSLTGSKLADAKRVILDYASA